MDSFYRYLKHYQNKDKQRLDNIDLLAWQMADYSGIMLTNIIVPTYQVTDQSAKSAINNRRDFPRLPNRMLKEQGENELSEAEKKAERERMFIFFKGTPKKSP